MLKLKLATGEHGANIDRIAALGTELVDQMKEIVWSLSPGNDRLDSLLLFIRQYFVILFEPLPHHIDIIFPPVIPAMQVESELRRNIFLCVKESLNNIIKHAGATSVQLHIAITNNTLLIQIKDNGVGFSIQSVSATGNGLKNIRRRMKSVNGKSDIFIQNGTMVVLEVDLRGYPNG